MKKSLVRRAIKKAIASRLATHGLVIEPASVPLLMRFKDSTFANGGPSEDDLREFRILLDGFAILQDLGVKPEGQLLQDAWVAGCHRGAGVFLEIGAGKPRLNSNTWTLEHALQWSGTRVEALPVFAQMHRDAAAGSRVSVIEAAVSATPGLKQFVDAGELTGDVTYLDGDVHSGFRSAMVRSGREFSVTAITPARLIDRIGSPAHIDFLSIDTEGSEMDIVNAMPWETTSFGCVCIEHNHRSSHRNLDQVMAAHGYERVLRACTGFDAWFRHRAV